MRTMIFAAVLGLIVCVPASAALDTSDAYFDGTTTWAGSSTMTNSTLSADVEWCVDFPAGSVYGQDLFTYKYQVTVTGTAPVTKFTVAMLPSNEAEQIGSSMISATDIAPTDASFNGIPVTTADWTFAGMTNGEVSYQLEYKSINAPLMFGGEIQDHGISASGDVPSPSNEIPEPATIGLLATGAIVLLRRRRS